MMRKSILTAVFWVLPLVALAHQFSYGAINTVLILDGPRILLETRAPLDLVIDPAYADKQRDLFEEVFDNELQIGGGGSPCVFALETLTKPSLGPEVIFKGAVTCPEPLYLDSIRIKNILFREYFQNYDHFVVLKDRDKTVELLFTPATLTYQASFPPASVSFGRLADQFLSMGIAHILSGYDHILFLLSVILLLGSMRRILVLITSFTVAHSVTLILAAIDIVRIPSSVVEPLIALSIAYVAFRNILQLRNPAQGEHLGERWITVFIFGLVHGLGFAGAITEANIPTQYFVLAVIVFNIGIEIGQLGLIFAFVPALRLLARIRYRNEVLLYASAVVCLLALVWFIERIT